MSKFSRTNRANDCPVCGDIRGKCRTTDDGGQAFVLCMTNGDAKLFDSINGYKCVKAGSKNWATFTPDSAAPQSTAEERQQRRAQREAEEKAIYQAGLSIAERHSNYSQIATQLPLHPDDRADLERRGLSAAAIASFASVEPWQQLSEPVSDRTPGSNGKKLLTKYSGYLVPARDVKGCITGFQIRNRAMGEGNPKYPWLSTSSRPANLQNGELPIAYAPGEGSVLNLCEGILKPAVAAEIHSAPFIGAAGGNFASSPEQLQQCISTLLPRTIALCPDAGAVENRQVMHQYSRTLLPRTIALCPDAGAVENRQVMHQYSLLAKLVAGLGYELKVRWWGQVTKANGDVDEISAEQFKASTLISWAEFAALAPEAKAKPGAQPQQQSKKAMTKAQWAEQQKLKRDRQSYAKIAELLSIEAAIDTDEDGYQQQARELFYQPLKQHLKYETHGELISGFASEVQAQTDGRSMLGYDCSQGTGKSNNALIPAALQTAKDGGRVLIFVPTRGLAREFKGRINERACEDIAATHLDSNYHSAAIVVSCPESAYKFKGQNFDLLQIDEANEVLHRIESAELGNAGPQSLAAFRKLLATTPKVAIATAAMSGRTLAAAQTIGGFTPDEVHLQRRSRPETKMKVIEYGNLYHWLQQIINALRSGQRVAIPVGSRGKGRMIDRVLRALFPGKNGLVIDGAATLQNQRTQFLADPDAFLSGSQPDWFIYTPVINSGVSIEGKHFDVQFEYATPNEGAQSISQRGERIRSAIGRDGAITERHIYFSQQGAPTLEAYPDALNWQYWADELENEANAPMGAAAALAKALGAEKALKPMQQAAEKFAGMRPNLPHLLALKAFEIIFKKELLHEDWERYGWNVSAAAAMNKDEADQAHQLHIFCDKVRIGLIEQQGRTLKKTQTREAEGELFEIDNPFQAARAAKAQLEKLLGKDYLARQNSKFFTAWSADKSAKNPGVRSIVRSQLLQIAIADPGCWNQIERMKTLKFLAGKPDPDSDLFWNLPELPAAARDIELVGIMARCPGIAEVIDGKVQRWTNQDPQVIAAGLYLVSHGRQIAANTKKSGLVRGAKFSEQMAPAALFNKALEVMGYKTTKAKREGTGDRLNVYRIEVEADAIAALRMLSEDGEDGLKLFRAELRVVRSQTRASIDAAAKSQIIAKALNWVSERTAESVKCAIAAIKGRHAVSYEDRLTNVGDALEIMAAEAPDGLTQMAFPRVSGTSSPPGQSSSRR